MNLEKSENRLGAYDDIEGAAFERYLLDLLRGWAEARSGQGNHGRRVIKDVNFVGDCFPHWGVEVEMVNPQNGRESKSRFPFEDWQSRRAAKEAISDILMAVAEGG